MFVKLSTFILIIAMYVFCNLQEETDKLLYTNNTTVVMATNASTYACIISKEKLYNDPASYVAM